MIFKPGRLCALWSLGGGELYLWGMKLSHKLRAGILFKLLLHRNQHCAMNDTIYLEGFLSKDEGQGLRIKNQGSRIKDQGSSIKDQGSRIKNQGSRIKDQHNIVHLVISDIYQPSNLFVFSSSTAWCHHIIECMLKPNFCIILRFEKQIGAWLKRFFGNYFSAETTNVRWMTKYSILCARGNKPTHLMAPIHLPFHHSCCNLFCQSICCKIIWFNLPKSNVMNFHILWHWKLNNWFQLE